MAAAAQAAAAGLFPPGLEALYRQAGFPSAFLSMGHHQPGSSPGGLTLPSMGHPPQQGGLQSHSNNPTSKCIERLFSPFFMPLLKSYVVIILQKF